MAVAEQYANEIPNDVVTTLTAGINNSTGTIPVAGFTGFPASAQYRIRIDDELLLVTAGAGTNSWTATRGVEGTTAASHSSGATVTHLLTRDGLLGVGGQINLDGTYAARAAAGVTGRLHLPSDGFGIGRDSGTSWAEAGPFFPFTAPVDGDFSWINQGGASVDTTFGGITLVAPGGGAGANLRVRVQSAPATPYVITAYLLPAAFNKAFHSYGLVFRQSSDGKLACFDIVSDGTSAVLRTTKFTNPTTFSADYQTARLFESARWFRIADNGTSRICSFSANGQTWTTFHTIGRTDFLTANQVGFVAGAENSTTPNLDAVVTLLSWKQT